MDFLMHIAAHAVAKLFESHKTEPQNNDYSAINSFRLKTMAEKHDPEACVELSNRYRIGHGALEKDEKQSSYWMNRAIDIYVQNTHVPASQYFKKNLSNWFNNTRTYDCCTYLTYIDHRGDEESSKSLKLYIKNFAINSREEILFTRDTSFWNSGDQGLVVTDSAIYVIKDNNSPHNRITLRLRNIKRVSFSNNSFFFYDHNNNAILSTDVKFFFKDLDIEDPQNIKIGKMLAIHLTEMAKLSQP